MKVGMVISMDFEGALSDPINRQILQDLSVDARLPIAELARRTGLSAPSVSERIRRLEDLEIITGYAAQFAPVALGYDVGVFIRIRPLAGQVAQVAELVAQMDEIVECHRVTGEDCFIAKAYLRSIRDLEPLMDKLLPLAQTHTSIIQSTPVPPRAPAIVRRADD